MKERKKIKLNRSIKSSLDGEFEVPEKFFMRNKFLIISK